MDLYEILSALSVLNRDDGDRFTRTDRLDAIASLLWNSRYRRINSDGLFHLYAAAPLGSLQRSVLVVSSHVDCHCRISNCFAQRAEDGCIRGTFDNAITNAAILSAMLRGDLPGDALVCFTGDEENGSAGARELSDFLRMHRLRPRGVLVLDVTDMGWQEGADFTVENDFWNEALGRQVVSLAVGTGLVWRYVPGYADRVRPYVPEDCVIRTEAEEDESWQYDEQHLPCFSLCLPVLGEMHSSRGVLARRSSFERYARVLHDLLLAL